MQKRVAFTLLVSVVFYLHGIYHTQSTVNYNVEIVHFGMTGCNDGQGSEEEPTWKLWSKDNINTSWDGGYCHWVDDFQPMTYIPPSNLSVSSRTNTLASTIYLKFEAWEDDCGSRCAYESSCGFFQGDDDYEYQNPIQFIYFQNDPPCTWNYYQSSVGCFSYQIRVKWEYSDFNAGTDTTTCFNSVPLTAIGNGDWSIYSGSGGSFTNGSDPTTTFFGNLGTSYTLLWESPSNSSCITNTNTDTVNVTFDLITSNDVITACNDYTWIDGVNYTSSNNSASQVLTTIDGCDSTVYLDLTINNTPNPNLTSSPLNSICNGEPITFFANNGANYDWQIGANGSVFQSGPGSSYYTDSLTSNDTVYVTVTTTDGCSATAFLHINVNQLPVCQIVPGDTSICVGTSVTLDGTNSNPVSYTWGNGNNSSSITVSNPGPYELTIMDNNGCRAYDTVTISNYPVTTITLGPDFSMCVGADTAISPGSGYLSYLWSNGSTDSITTVGPGTHSVTIQDSNTCDATTDITISTFQANLIDLGNDSLICEDNTFILDAGAGFNSYIWNTGETSSSININTIGTYFVDIVSRDGCTDADTIVFDTLVNQFQLSPDTTIFMGGSVDLIAYGGVGYLWDNGSTNDTVNYDPTNDIVVWVVIDNGNACYDSAYVNIFVNDNLNIFIPNMFSPNGDGNNDNFLIYGYGLQESISFKIYSRWNKVVYQTDQLSTLLYPNGNGWDGKFNGEDQPDGVYIWTMSSTDINGISNPLQELTTGSLLLNR